MHEMDYDAIIVGAGLSGIGMAYHLQQRCPGLSFTILEGRDRLGGTWDLFRYPGVRSDSDMHTLGYSFKPWLATKSIAAGPSILAYIEETAAENGLETHIRYNHQVETAAWSSPDACWTVRCRVDGKPVTLRANFLLLCAGYYSYKSGYQPEFPGAASFQGPIVHPQGWPDGLDYRDKRVIVIGSGATAVTLVPALAETAGHVVMLQRSPTYMAARPAEDKWARWLRYLLPATWLYRLIRWKNIKFQQFVYHYSREKPAQLKKRLLQKVRRKLGPDYDIETHFTPNYNPWDERLCLVPDGDLFKAIKAGRAEVVTAEIERFTPDGVRLQSGVELAADIIVTATGLNLEVQGGIAFTVDGEPVDFARTFIYKGVMNAGVPNLINTFGYVNASWTLRADLIAAYSCRLLNHMRRHGYRQVTPRLRPEEADMTPRPWSEEFTPGYIARSLDRLPKQGTHLPWLNVQTYELDKKLLIQEPLADGVLQFDN